MSADGYRPKSPDLNFFGGAEQQPQQQHHHQTHQTHQSQHHQNQPPPQQQQHHHQQLYHHQQPPPPPQLPDQPQSFSYIASAQPQPQPHQPLHVNPPSPTQNWYQAAQDDPYGHARSYSYSAQVHSPTEFGGFYPYHALSATTPPYTSSRFPPSQYQQQQHILAALLPTTATAGLHQARGARGTRHESIHGQARAPAGCQDASSTFCCRHRQQLRSIASH
ncbi:hypothetical protein BD289DRAFT_116037 [Coniella lustricola]|uniref:Uncharacterized protein n=1 Tax=Coniella lustricola TaxID=2025994 RepID=A0A2T2ZX06_9PEZI|nr:hypothetical protein BD289DRAFT_116037 [Coniella lustricola]